MLVPAIWMNRKPLGWRTGSRGPRPVQHSGTLSLGTRCQAAPAMRGEGGREHVLTPDGARPPCAGGFRVLSF